ncbi:MAG: SpoIIE family protein phosphatase [bacterium]|nr:SpoIIE family protein phosphatase [bacterium]
MANPDSQSESSTEPLFRAIDGRLILRRNSEINYILEMALDEIKSMVKARRAEFFFFNEAGELTAFRPPEAGAESQQAGMRRLSEYCIRERTSYNYRKPRLNPDASPEILRSAARVGGPVAGLELEEPALCVYLGLQEGELGAVCLSDPIFFDHFFEADLNLVKNFAATFSILLRNGWADSQSSEIYLNFRSSLLLLLDNAHLNQKIKYSDYRLNTVLEVSNLINSSRELNEMIQAVLYSSRRVLRAQSASLFLVDEETGELYFDIVTGKEGDALKGFRIPPGQGIVGLCAREKRSIVVNDAPNDPRIYRVVDEYSQNITRNLMAAPLMVNDRCIGVLEVINTIDRSYFNESDMELFESLSDSVAIAVQRRMLLDDVEKKNQELERKLRESSTLHAVTRVLVEVGSADELFLRVLETIHSNMHIKRLSVLLYRDDLDELEVKATVGFDPRSPAALNGGETTAVAANAEGLGGDDGDAAPIAANVNVNANPDTRGDAESDGRSLGRYVFDSNQSLFVKDFAEEPPIMQRFTRPDRYRTPGCILIPLAGSRSKRPYGVLCASDPGTGEFLEEDFPLLSTIASQVTRGYENWILNQESMAKKAIEKEVEITSRIQQNILPSDIPDHMHMELGASSVMAQTTGGDFYDYHVHSPNGQVTLLVADVSGKSLPAALFMAISSSILRTIIRSESDPVQILTKANDLIYEESQSGMFVTVFLARYDPHTGILSYASAGHNEMLLMHSDGEYEMLSGKGHPLGVLPSHRQRYHGGQRKIRGDDLLVLYTDGVSEAMNAMNDEYGLEKFIRLLRANRDRKPAEMIDIVYRSVLDFSGTALQSDDFTMLVSRFQGALEGVREYHLKLPAHKDSIPALRDRLMQICIRHGLFGDELDDILLVSDEAATNILVHAYADTTLPNPDFECDLQIESHNYVRINFRDQGRAFRMDDVKEPDVRQNLAGKRKGGFGVYLIKSLMNRVEYRRENGVNYLFAEKDLQKS